MSGRGTAATAPSITTSHNNEKVVALFGTNTGKSNGETFATSTGMTKLYDVKNTPFGPTVMVENMAQASIGPTGIISSTFSSGPSHDWATQVISLRGSGDLQNGILAYWKLDGNSADATGNGHTGTDTTITYSGANGIINQGAGMSAANNSFIAITDSTALKPTSNFTVSGWIKTTNSGVSRNASLFQSYSQNTSVAGFRLSQSSRKMEIIVGQNTGLINGLDYKQVDSMSNMDDGLWHMWTAVYDGSRLSIYKDGNSTPDASDISTINPEYASTNYVRIGDHNFNGTDYDTADASMDEVGLWNRALSSAEISQLYNGGIGLQHPF